MKVETSYIRVTREKIEQTHNIEDLIGKLVIYHEDEDESVEGVFTLSGDGVVIKWEDGVEQTPVNSKRFDSIKNDLEII